MNKNKILVVLIVLLLLANMAWLFLYIKKDKQPRREGRRMFLQSQLEKEAGFSKEQIAQFETLRERQRTQMQPLLDSMEKLRGQVFDIAIKTNNDSSVIRSISQVAAIQQKIDLQRLENMREAKRICTPQQIPKFDSLMKRMMMFSGGRRKGQREK
jgi:periplasmic protein CpxP/Spy